MAMMAPPTKHTKARRYHANVFFTGGSEGAVAAAVFSVLILGKIIVLRGEHMCSPSIVHQSFRWDGWSPQRAKEGPIP